MRTMLALAFVALALPALALATAESMSPVVSAKLKGSAEIPKGDPDGTGLVVLHLSTTKARGCWDFKGVAKIGKPNAAHIHKGRTGVAGPVVIPLGTAYKAKGCKKASASLIEARAARCEASSSWGCKARKSSGRAGDPPLLASRT